MRTFKEYVEYREGIFTNIARGIGSTLSRWGRKDLSKSAQYGNKYPPHIVAAWNAAQDLDEPAREIQGAAAQADDPEDRQSLANAGQQIAGAKRTIMQTTARNTQKVRNNMNDPIR